MIGIYKIENKINGKIYVGQSICIERRWEEHLYHSSHCSLLKYALEKYGKDNFIFSVIEECVQSDLDEREIYWINYYNSYKSGYNLTRGGRGTVQYSVEEIYNDYMVTGSMNQTAKNIKCSINTVRKVLHEYGIDKTNLQENKPVEAVDTMTLKVVKKYSSIQEAADDNNITRGAITKVLSGRGNSAAGYYWRLQGEEKTFVASSSKRWKNKVQQIDIKTQKVINEFESAADAADFLGKDRKNGGSQIIAVCNGRRKTAYGYLWKKL